VSVSVCVSVWGACPGNCFLQLRLFVSFTAWELSVFWARALPEIRQKSIKKSCELPRKAPSKGFDGGRFPYGFDKLVNGCVLFSHKTVWHKWP